jgi:hypothetical protein
MTRQLVEVARVCSACRRALPLMDFWQDPTGPNGRHQMCRTCCGHRRAPKRKKTCPQCQRTLNVNQKNFYRQSGRFDPWCKRCRRAINRERYRREAQDPDKVAHKYALAREARRRRRAVDPEYAERERQRVRDYRARVKRERPDLWLRWKEDARIRSKLQTERQGWTIHPAPKDKWIGRGRTVYLDPAPLLALLATVDVVHEKDGPLARTVRRLHTGESAHVELSIADAIALRAGVMVHDLYPELAA